MNSHGEIEELLTRIGREWPEDDLFVQSVMREIEQLHETPYACAVRAHKRAMADPRVNNRAPGRFLSDVGAEELIGHQDLEHPRDTTGGHPAITRSRWDNPLLRFVLATTVVATLILCAFSVWNLATSVSLADVAVAVRGVAWIHETDIAPDGTRREFWYSPQNDISATRTAERMEYRDHRLRTYYVYDFADKTLYRVPEIAPLRSNIIESRAVALRVLLEHGRLNKDPLEHIGFLRDAPERLEIVHQKLERTREGGSTWLDYDVTVRSSAREQATFQFRVDPETKLLARSRTKVLHNEKTVVWTSQYDYPAKGPIDVYELGVPKSAELVDRVPKGDMARIVEALSAGRQRMDDYRAVVMTRDQSLSFIMYRKGNKFRRDDASWKTEEIMKRAIDEHWPNPVEGETMTGWWAKHWDELDVRPASICTESNRYSIQTKRVRDSSGKSRWEIESVKKRTLGRSDNPFPDFWSTLPEFICRPPLGIPHEDTEVEIQLQPENGPPGTVLLRTRFVGRSKGRLGQTFWLDPQRDYAVVRFPVSGGDSLQSYIIDEMARSPQGIWYAKQSRQSWESDDERGETIWDFYLDFDVDLPDSLFEPPRPGRVD